MGLGPPPLSLKGVTRFTTIATPPINHTLFYAQANSCIIARLFKNFRGQKELNYLGGTGASWFERTQSHTMLVSRWGEGAGARQIRPNTRVGLLVQRKNIYIFRLIFYKLFLVFLCYV